MKHHVWCDSRILDYHLPCNCEMSKEEEDRLVDIGMEVASLHARVRHLHEALATYGAHRTNCPMSRNVSMHGCRCGLDQAKVDGGVYEYLRQEQE